MFDAKKFRQGFTLIEMLIVIGVITTLSVVTIIVLNPVELLRESRDSNRLSDINMLKKTLIVAQVEIPFSEFGTPNTVYTSLPDNAATTTTGTNCDSLNLPSLPAGWFYHCASPDNYRKIDGTGWIPINFNQLTYKSPLGILPKDPTNTAASGFYYTYVASTKEWEINASMESKRMRFGGSKDSTLKDGGDSFTLLETGSNITLSPLNDAGLVGYWSLDESSSTTAYDTSGFNHNGTMYSSSTITDLHISNDCKVKSCANFDGTDDWINLFTNWNGMGIHNRDFTMMVWVKAFNILNERQILGEVGYMQGLSLYNPSNYVFKMFNTPTYNSFTSQKTGISINTWYMLTGVFSKTNNTVQLFVNEEPQSISAFSGNTFDPGRFAIGGVAPNHHYSFPGIIDEVRIYNRTLSPAEIQNIYKATR